MLVAMGRYVASKPRGRGKNGGSFHSFPDPPFFPSLSIKNMYDVHCSSSDCEICG
jgi:hypothetical protein